MSLPASLSPVSALPITNKPETIGKAETFRQIVERLQPSNVALAKLSRAADIDYNYLLKLMRDTRPGKTIHPKPDKGEDVLNALEEKFNVAVTDDDRLAMVNACVAPPEGYRIVREENAIIYQTEEQTQHIVEAYRNAPIPVRAALDALASAMLVKSAPEDAPVS